MSIAENQPEFIPLLRPISSEIPSLTAKPETIVTYLNNIIDLKETRPEVLRQQLIDQAQLLYPGSRSIIEPVIDLVDEAHGKVSRKGNPQMLYIIHPLSIALLYAHSFPYHQQYHTHQENLSKEEIKKRFIDGIIICLAHDVLEDTDFPIWDKKHEATFGNKALAGILKMTIDKRFSDEFHYEKLEDTISIKALDTWHNIKDFMQLDLTVEWGNKSVQERLIRYIEKAQTFLMPRLQSANSLLYLFMQTTIAQAEQHIAAHSSPSLRRQAS